jgi:plastocyanin
MTPARKTAFWNHLSLIRIFPIFSAALFLAAILAVPQAAKAQGTWNLNVGAESKDQGRQADAFLVNEAWIWVNDSITWHWQPKNEVHTVTLLQQPPGAPPSGFFPPPFAAAFGCPASQASPATYSGAACVSSGVESGSTATFTVKFTNPGNYKFICLIHPNMNGALHVLQSADSTKPFYATSLPYNQWDYNKQAKDEGGGHTRGRRQANRRGAGLPPFPE